jgi:hypothetical protein
LKKPLNDFVLTKIETSESCEGSSKQLELKKLSLTILSEPLRIMLSLWKGGFEKAQISGMYRNNRCRHFWKWLEMTFPLESSRDLRKARMQICPQVGDACPFPNSPHHQRMSHSRSQLDE